MINKKKITIKDVADKAQVAPSTVSRVLNNNSRISTQTKELVLKTMDDLGYHPNAAARSLVQKRTNSLGLILPNNRDDLFLNPFFIMTMRGFSIYAQDQGYNLLYSFSREEEVELEYIRDFTRGHLIDGILLFTSRVDDKCISYLQDQDFPFVVIGRPVDSRNIYWVDNDNFQAAYNAVNTLVDQGHSRIAFISSPRTYHYAQSRYHGYCQALENRGLEHLDLLQASVPEANEEQGQKCMQRILKHETPDAVLATDDFLAIGALEELNKREIHAAVIGFNNTLKGQYQNPSLSSIDVNAETMGHHAARLLIDRVQKGELKINNMVVPAELIQRESTLGRTLS